MFFEVCAGGSAKAEAVVRHLENGGWSIWWDRQLHPRSGMTFDRVIEAELASAHCVLVLWSRHSIQSHWAKAEAMEALEVGKLIQARLEDVKPPLPFRAFHSASLMNWNDSREDLEFQSLCTAILHFVPVDEGVSLEDARSIIAEMVRARRTKVVGVERAPDSPAGTKAYRARSSDGMGVVYCHASGPLRGHAYYVRKGIGYVYEYLLGGSTCSLGLPTSNEELVDGNGFPTSYFERGYIDWSPQTGLARAMLLEAGREHLILQREI
jgi:hypothetical protein